MKRQKILPTFLFLFLLSLLLLLAGKAGWTKPIVTFGGKITIPLKEAIYRRWQRMTGGLRESGEQGELREKNERGKAELLVKVNSLEEENKALRKQLEAPLPRSMKFLPAKTLGLTRYLTIDKGEEEGVRPGATVVVENILVGKVISQTPKTSQILLPTDPDSKIPVKTLKTQAHGLAIGEFGTKLFLDKVLQAEMLESGDLVVTTGEDDYRRDLLIGKLGNLEKKEVEPFQKAEIEPLLDYGKLVNVFIITD